MQRIIMRSKLHRLTVTEANIDYEGSITIDKELLQAADIIPGERVQIVNLNNGLRFETYAIEGGPGEVCLNGGAARLTTVGDKILVITYGIIDDSEINKVKPKVILVGDSNKIKR